MVKNPKLLEKFESELSAKEKTDYFKNLQIVEELYQEARALGIFPLKDPLDGIEIDIKIARVLNSV